MKRRRDRDSPEDLEAKRLYRGALDRLGKRIDVGPAAMALDPAKGWVRHVPEEYTPTWRISNIVAVFALDSRYHAGKKKSIDLRTLQKAIGGNYNPGRFTGLRVRWGPSPRVALLIFSTGSVVITGAKSYTQITLAIGMLRYLLKKKFSDAPYVVRMHGRHPFQTRNTVLSMRLPYRLNLQEIARVVPSASYLPSLFPCLFWDMRLAELPAREPKKEGGRGRRRRAGTTMLITRSGGILLAGLPRVNGSASPIIADCVTLVKQFCLHFRSNSGAAR